VDLAELRAELACHVARICPSWMSSRAEDIVQVAFKRVIDVACKQEGNTEFSSFYLKKVAHSATVDEIRRQRRRPEVPLEEADDEPVPAPQPDPVHLIEAREIGEAIHECLGRMIRPRRLAVTLHLQGHAVAEIARLLGWPPKKAENLVYRGMADLRSCLEAKGLGR